MGNRIFDALKGHEGEICSHGMRMNVIPIPGGPSMLRVEVLGHKIEDDHAEGVVTALLMPVVSAADLAHDFMIALDDPKVDGVSNLLIAIKLAERLAAMDPPKDSKDSENLTSSDDVMANLADFFSEQGIDVIPEGTEVVGLDLSQSDNPNGYM